MKILLVEDDQSTSELLAATLTAHRYAVDIATDGKVGLELATLWNYDLLALDVQIPKIDGISVCRQLRSQGCSAPIIILTAHGSTDDIIRGLDAGADDYMTKPCDPEQLLARIRALLRRTGASQITTLTWGKLCLNPALVQVTYASQSVTLRPKEYSLLELFLRHPQRVFSRNAIIDHLWTIDNCPTEHAVTNLIKDLRRQLKAVGMGEELIETVYGLGYRLNSPPTEEVPIAPETIQEPLPVVSPTPADPTTAAGVTAIAQIAERFRQSLAERLTSLQAGLQSLQGNLLSTERRLATQAEAHRLAGSLGTFGYAQGSELARMIDHLLNGNTALEPSLLSRCFDLFAQLQEVLAIPLALPAADTPVSSELPLVLLVGNPTELVEALCQEANSWGVQCQPVPTRSMSQIADTLSGREPIAILFMLTHNPSQDDTLAMVQNLKEQFPGIPVLILADQDNFADRIRVARVGGDRYLTPPLIPSSVFQEIAQLVPQSPVTVAKVLIVDDDPLILAHLTQLLQPWGLQIMCLDDPNQFWTALTTMQPDLLLLDVEMPTFNGIELCRVVRQDPRHGDLPILVVSAHTDVAAIQRVFAAGADDLISKPVVGPELVTRVLSRIERSRLRQQLNQLQQQQTRLWRQQVNIDALTQVANRHAGELYLQQEWQRRLRSQENLSLILCDIDYFKPYNDRYGQRAGDSCLHRVATTIQGCIKFDSDQIARYGDDVFAVILPGTLLTDALSVAHRIQQAIAQLQLPHETSPVSASVTVSMGITGTLPTANKACDDLLATAEQALNAAKSKGRNTYCLYPL